MVQIICKHSAYKVITPSWWK